jgi:tryptophanyl-tRNA synthetase
LTPTSKLLGIDRRKMSKSYNNAIFITEAPETVSKKVSQMITDPQRGRKTDPGRPEICNVFSFHEIYTQKERIKEIEKCCRTATIGCVE